MYICIYIYIKYYINQVIYEYIRMHMDDITPPLTAIGCICIYTCIYKQYDHIEYDFHDISTCIGAPKLALWLNGLAVSVFFVVLNRTQFLQELPFWVAFYTQHDNMINTYIYAQGER